MSPLRSLLLPSLLARSIFCTCNKLYVFHAYTAYWTFAYEPAHGQSSHGLVNSQTGQFTVWTNYQEDIFVSKISLLIPMTVRLLAGTRTF